MSIFKSIHPIDEKDDLQLDDIVLTRLTIETQQTTNKQCQEDLAQCQQDLAQCQQDLAQCQEELAQCQQDLAQCQQEKQSCKEKNNILHTMVQQQQTLITQKFND